MKARLLLIDDHPVVRAGLKAFLELQGDLEVVGEAGSLAEARALLPAADASLVLLDVKLADGSGLELLPELLGVDAPPKVLILTSFSEDDTVREAMRRGATGYLLKHHGPEALVDRVRAALRGELPLDPAAVRALTASDADPLAELTPREREVLALIAGGLSNREIAARLGVREKTVKSHASRVFEKLGVERRTQAALRARELGLAPAR